MAGGGRRKRANKPKTRQSVKDHLPHAENELPELTEELTALSSIFQDDFTLISEAPFTEFSIRLQPHSGGIGSSSENVFAELHVRCLPGYPYKPPKLHVKANEGLSEEELHLLHSMLVDQASSISREGRVMVFNLVEAAQEFLSEHVGSEFSQEEQQSQVCASTVDDPWLVATNATENLQDIKVPPVYGILDLFTELGDDNDWQAESHQRKKSGVEKNVGSSIASVGRQDPLLLGYIDASQKNIRFGELNTLVPYGEVQGLEKKVLSDLKSKDVKLHIGQLGTEKLTVVDEKNKEVTVCTPRPLQFSSVSEFLQKLCTGVYSSRSQNCKPVEEGLSKLLASIEQEGRAISSADAMCLNVQDGGSESVHKDFLLVHLLRLVCCQRGPLPRSFPALASHLQKLHIIPNWMTDLVTNQPQLFDLAFHQVFADCISETNTSSEGHAAAKSFWNASSELLSEHDSSHSRVNSRYSNDFEELSLLGRGGFGHVVLCRNKLDGRLYAMKKIRLNDRSPLNNKILREVATLSRLQHHHIVRYYQAWFETVVGILNVGSDLESSGEWILSGMMDKADSSIKSLLSKGMTIDDIEEKLVETTYLYIQMEYCPRTLREVLNANTKLMDEATAWRIFRQIVEGLAHIHGQGIIHRDLTPSNIFFDVRNDIKIGDFGLAKFTNLEQPDRESHITPDPTGGSLDGTSQVGTYFYIAPELDQGWPHVDEKVDMYSLGVILFELWHPFVTAMERRVVLSELKNKEVPSLWAMKFPQQATLVRSLMAPDSTDRPSAMHVLRNNLPPRMEDEALDDVLRMIQRADHSYILDQIISALFDEERISLIAQKLDREQLTYALSEKPLFQDQILGIAKDVFTSHGAQRFCSHSLSLVADGQLSHRIQVVRLIDSAGRMLELRSETRKFFACWLATNQITSIKCFEISQVYRKAAGPSAPQEYYQGDFDIIGETSGLSEAEAIKVVVDILHKSAITDSYEIYVNHANILEAVWAWSGVKRPERRDVAKLLSSVGCLPPQSSDRKSRWVHIRRQLMQGLKLPENVVDRLQTVERRWSGCPDEALSRLRGGLADSPLTSSAIDELSTLQSYLRVWNIGKHVYVDALMAPVEEYYKGLFFQVNLPKGCCHANSSAGMLLAVGGRYDQLVQQFRTTPALTSVGAVGLSIALEKLILAAASEGIEPERGAEVLVCSKGGGGLLRERMEVVSELWDGNIKADFVHSLSPSLTEQYEYAHEHGIKWLVILTEAGLTHANSVKVRHMEVRVEEDVARSNLVRFFSNVPVTATNIRRQAAHLRKEFSFS